MNSTNSNSNLNHLINNNHHNTTSSNSNIKVYIRLRPLAEHIETPIDLELNQNEIILKKSNQSRIYCFDGIFNSKSKQIDLSEKIINPIIDQVNDGFNCTVFAYGQTGTGKTYTIEGDFLNDKNQIDNNLINQDQENINLIDEQLPSKVGLVPRAFFKLFKRLKEDDLFTVSVIEIYNEEVYDLLSDNSDQIRIYESHKGVTFSSLVEYQIKNLNDLNIILEKSNSKRQFASTLMNTRSSRSHVIYQYVYHSKETLPNNQVIKRVGKLNLVDLAGSECAKRTGCQGERQLEASNINKSLLALTNVIDALANNSKYIPFRRSNLTRIIQDTLGGNSKTVLIATLSPAIKDYENTINTLLFASTVKQVKQNAIANVKLIDNNLYEEKLKHLEEILLLEQNKHKKELDDLKDELKNETEKLKIEYELKLKSIEDELDNYENKLELKDEEIKTLKRNIDNLNKDISNNSSKENDLQPLNKKRKSTKRLTANNSSITSPDNLIKSIKDHISNLTKEQTEVNKRVNKLNKLITNQLENQLKELLNKKKTDKKTLICTDQLEENLISFLNQMINFAIQDEFDLFLEYLKSDIQPELNDGDADQLEERFKEFNEYVRQKLELVIETTENKLNSNEEQLEKQTNAINEINKIQIDLSKEIKECVKRFKKCKDRATSIKEII